VVLDLRHNDGGSGSWSYQTAQALWGDAFVLQRLEDYFRGVRILWRASDGNIAYMKKLEDSLRKDGEVKRADEISKVRDGMIAARAKGEFYYDEGEDKTTKPKSQRPLALDFTTPIYVITPGRCASAGLDPIDVLKRFDNVKLIGAPTSGDTTYMEVRSSDLPSGEGKGVVPVKLWSGRPRGSGEVYRPDIEVRDVDWSIAAFLNRIERDLATRSVPTK